MANNSGDGGGGGGSCCNCCLRLILTSGLTALFMWLSLRASAPVCSIEDIYIPPLNRSENSNYSKIYFHLKLDNQNKDKGVYYDLLNLTFYYAPNFTSPICNFSIPGFYQGHKKSTRRKGWVDARGVPWAAAREAAANGSAVFRVDLATAVRFKIMAWKTKRRRLVVGGGVAVNGLGKKVAKKGVRLKSGGCRARLEPVVVIFSVVGLVLFI